MGKHLTFEQRYQLAALHRAGLTQAAIAAQIGSSHCSTASSIPRKLTPPVIAIIKAQIAA